MPIADPPPSMPPPGAPPRRHLRGTPAYCADTTAKFLSELADRLIKVDIANEVIADILVAVAPVAVDLVAKGNIHAS